MYKIFNTFILVTLFLFAMNSKLMAQNCGISDNIGGTVYGDFNANGINDESLTELSGIIVTAYDDNGTAIAQNVTNKRGKYLLLVPNGKKVRLEFTNLPEGMHPGFFGNNSGTSIQFVTSPTCTADFGLMNYSSYCEDNPNIALACYVNGDPLAGGNAGNVDAFVGFGYNQIGTSPSVDHIAIGQEVGALWGTAWDRKERVIFASSILKRHAGFGPLGIGGIYMINNYPGSGTVSNFIDLSNCINVGAVTRPDLPANTDIDNYDSDAYLNVGKKGLGNIAISEDGTNLWVVNLNSKTLVRIRIRATPNSPINTSPSCGDVTEFSIPNSCGAEMRPWAVEWHNGLLYVGTVCDQSLLANTYTFDPQNETFSASILSFSLVEGIDIDKGCVTFSEGCQWYSWTDNYPTGIQSYPLEVIYPQPIFSDIDFDAQGNMVLSFIDRFGHQTGFSNYYLPGSQTRYSGNSGGDLYYAYNDNGTFVFEENGNLVNGSGQVIRAGCGIGGTGGIEFFCQEDWKNVHQETSLGASVIHRGHSHLVTSVYDPFDAFSGGMWWADLSNGQPFARNQLYAGAGTGFGKAAGLGEPSLLCGIAPIQIGNYVWQDNDKDGLQDPSEPPLSGVTVQLIDANGTVVATTTTDANGQYLFDSNTTPAITAYTDYYIVLPNAVTGVHGNTMNLTTANNTGSDINDSDGTLIATDVPANVQNLPAISITTANYGENNHSYDFGFSDCPIEISYDLIDCDFTGTTSINLQVVVQWTSMPVGDVLDITVDGNMKSHTIANVNGSVNLIFAGVSDNGNIQVTNQNDPDCIADQSYQVPNYFTLSPISVSDCSFDPVTYESVATVSFDLSWTLLPAGEVINVQLGNQTQTINVTGNGTQSLSFDVPADGSTANPVEITTGSNSCATLSSTYDLPPSCPECGVNAVNVSVGECSEPSSGVYESELTVEVSWIFATVGEELNVSVPSANAPSSQSITVGAISGSQIFTFTVPANGTVSNPITFSWTSGLSCTIQNTTYDARPACITTHDIALNKEVDISTANPGDIVTFSISVVNQSSFTATGIEVTDALQAGLSYQSDSPSQGTYNSGTNVWTVGTLSPGQMETLTFVTQVDADAIGVYFNEAEVTLMSEDDKDSTPANNDKREDDWDDACVSVPVTLCGSETFRVEAESGYYGYQWYFDNGGGAVAMSGETSNILIINAGVANSGSYYYEAYLDPAQTTLIQVCCPVIIDNTLCNCNVSVDNVSIPNCIADPNQTTAEIVVEVSWLEVPLPNDLIVDVDGTQQTFNLTTADGNQSFVFTVPSDGSTGNISASLTNDSTTGNAGSVSGGGNPSLAVGPILAAGTSANNSNSNVLNNSNPSSTMTLEHTVPAGTDITISIAKNNSGGDIDISDGTNTLNFNSGTEDVLQHITFTTGTVTNTLTFTRNGGGTWIDGVEYTISGTCNDATTFVAPDQCTNCNLTVSGINVGNCIFPANEHSLDFTINWTDANIGDVIEIFAGGAFQNHIVSTASGSQTFSFTAFSTGITETIVAQINDVLPCEGTATYTSPNPCPPCELTLDYALAGTCKLNAGTSEVSVTIGFSWLYATDSQIEIIVEGQTFTYNTGGDESGTATFNATGLPADGNAHNITIQFANDTSCSDTGTYTSDGPCPACELEILSVNNEGACYYDYATGESYDSLTVSVRWANALPGSSIKFIALDPAGAPNDTIDYYLFIEPTYSLVADQTTVSFAIPATGQSALLNVAMLPDYTCNAPDTPYSSEEPCCVIDVTNVSVGECTNPDGTSQASLEVEVFWDNIPTGGVIDVNVPNAIGTQNIQIDPATSNSPSTVQFTVPADGSLNNSILLSSSSGTCSITNGSYDAPDFCCPVPVCLPVTITKKSN